MELFKSLGDIFLFLTTPIVVGASLWLSIKTRFIQFRKIPYMLQLFFSLLFKSKKGLEGQGTIQAHRALLTAMSTTIGISTIVSPAIAIRLGGPGAVIGFFIATVLGAAVNFTEVTLALSYRKHNPKSGVAGGPMQYLQDEISPFLAKWYAFFAVILLLGWSAAQANQLGEILNSPLLGSIRVSNWISGLFLAIFVTIILVGGITRIANFSAKLVPAMFGVYVTGALWIVCTHAAELPAIFNMIVSSAFRPQTFATGITVGGIVSALRWGIFKGLHGNEAGVGTQTIPHSMAQTKDPYDQGILAMISTYSAGFICILSSLVTLITATWLDSSLSLGINMVAASFYNQFAYLGIIIVVISAFLFAFGTILGNSFNGGQCFSYLTKNRFIKAYYLVIAVLIYVGSVSDVAAVWSFVDYLLVPVLIPHIISVVYLAYKQKGLFVVDMAVAKSS